MQTKKIKAFTITEMIVVLMIASIVISMAFLVLNMVKKQVALIQQNYQKKQEIRFLETALSRDFNTNNAYYDPKKDMLLLKNSKKDIHYQFLKNKVIREKDTFKVEITSKKLFLEGQSVTSETIDAIELHFSKDFGDRQLFIQQIKDARFWMKEGF